MTGPHPPAVALLPPKLDVVFKCLFASEPALLADLLNAILPVDGYAPAAALQVLNPDIDRETISAKQIVLDIRALDTTGRQFNVELQVQRQASYIPRAIFYLARLHASQLGSGQTYDQICPTLGIHLLDFTLDTETPTWRHCFEWRERMQPAWRLTDQQALWLIELPKARAVLTPTAATAHPAELDWWAQFFNDPEAIMTTETPVPAPVRRALAKLQELSADERTRQLAEERQRALIDWQLERHALLIEGEAKGEAKAKHAFARQLLKEGFSVDKTAALTGLTVDEVQTLTSEKP